MKNWTVYVENAQGESLGQTDVEAVTQAEAEKLGDEIFKKNEWAAGYPEGYFVGAYENSAVTQRKLNDAVSIINELNWFDVVAYDGYTESKQNFAYLVTDASEEQMEQYAQEFGESDTAVMVDGEAEIVDKEELGDEEFVNMLMTFIQSKGHIVVLLSRPSETIEIE